ncbi:MAG TPA: hypothetical protein VN787_03005 [Steroidobacteraceae bacterium]|nr:hypothetical protein [Steroidobacteraceae bacterium]
MARIPVDWEGSIRTEHLRKRTADHFVTVEFFSASAGVARPESR